MNLVGLLELLTILVVLTLLFAQLPGSNVALRPKPRVYAAATSEVAPPARDLLEHRLPR